MREIRCCHACDIVVKGHNNFVLNRSHWFNACLCARDISVWNIVYSHLYFWNNILPFFLQNDYIIDSMIILQVFHFQLKVENLSISSIGQCILCILSCHGLKFNLWPVIAFPQWLDPSTIPGQNQNRDSGKTWPTLFHINEKVALSYSLWKWSLSFVTVIHGP